MKGAQLDVIMCKIFLRVPVFEFGINRFRARIYQATK